MAPDREAHAGLRGRRIGLAALSLAGALWLANVALGTGGEHTYAQSTLDYVEVLAYSAALLGLVPALLVLRSWDQRRSGRLGAIALFSAGAGAAIAAAANFGEDALGVKALGDSVYFPAVLVLMLGLLLLGVALLRAPAPWRWIAAWPLATLGRLPSRGQRSRVHRWTAVDRARGSAVGAKRTLQSVAGLTLPAPARLLREER